MFTWAPYPFLRIVLTYIAGIIIYDHFSFEIAFIPIILTITFLTFGFYAFVKNRNQKYGQALLGNIGLFLVLLLGMYRSNEVSSVNRTGQLISHINSVTAYTGIITRIVSEKQHLSSYQLDVRAISLPDSVYNLDLKLILRVKNDSVQNLSKVLRCGDKIIVPGSPRLIEGPKNPGEFDYQMFMKNSGIMFQHFSKRSSIVVVANSMGNEVINISQRLASYLKKTIHKHLSGLDETSIAQALLLGDKNGLTKDIRQSYATAGAMHVLAVSGLHVGTIYFLLAFIFKPFTKNTITKILFGMISICCLFGYALVTGLSPSVLRATTMFAVVILGEVFSRKSNIYNSLSISALILLIMDPRMLFHIGFQLSYIAVLGIVFLTPQFSKICPFHHFLLKKAWLLSSVSVAAQIATFPFTIHYFHQFPAYFLFSNFIVIPGAFIIMVLGLLLFAFSMFSFVKWIGVALETTIYLLNQGVRFIERLDYSLIEGIQIDQFQTILFYLIILSLLRTFHFRRFQYTHLTIIFCLIYSVYGIRQIYNQSNSDSLLIYHVNKHAFIDKIDGLNVYPLFASKTIPKKSVEQHVIPYRLKHNLTELKLQNLPTEQRPIELAGIRFFVWHQQRIAQVFSQPNHISLEKKIVTDLLIISNNAIASLSELDTLFDYKKLIIDASNSYQINNALMIEAQKKGVIVYSIRNEGSLLIEEESFSN